MTSIADAAVWIVGGAILLILQFVAAVSAPFCRNQPRYEDDI